MSGIGRTDYEGGGPGPEAEHTLSGEELLMALAAYLKTKYGSIGNLEVVREVIADAADGTPGEVVARRTFTRLS